MRIVAERLVERGGFVELAVLVERVGQIEARARIHRASSRGALERGERLRMISGRVLPASLVGETRGTQQQLVDRVPLHGR